MSRKFNFNTMQFSPTGIKFMTCENQKIDHYGTHMEPLAGILEKQWSTT